MWVVRARAGRRGRGRLGAVHPRHGRRTPTPHLPWWAVALGFAGAELCVVHVRFRRSAHSFSLADLPFVFGLVFATGDDFVLGALVGTAIVLRPDPPAASSSSSSSTSPSSRSPRRSPPRSCTLIAGGADALQPADVGRPVRRHALLRRAHDPAARRRDRDRRGRRSSAPMLVQMFATDALVTLINASIAIAAALVVATDPRAVPVLLIPALTVFAVYRAYISERQRHERLEFLYDANRTLSPLARGRRGARGAARPLPRGLQRRRRRGPAVHRRRRPAAHHARPGRPARDDGAGRPARSPRSSPASSTPRTPSSASPRPSAPRTCAPTCRRAASATR